MTADVAPVVDHSADIAALCMVPSKSHRENASLRQRMQAVVSDSADLQHRLSKTEKESQTWNSAALKTTELIDSLHKSI